MGELLKIGSTVGFLLLCALVIVIPHLLGPDGGDES